MIKHNQSNWQRVCHRCGNIFYTDKRFGKVCQRCMKPRGWEAQKGSKK